MLKIKTTNLTLILLFVAFSFGKLHTNMPPHLVVLIHASLLHL